MFFLLLLVFLINVAVAGDLPDSAVTPGAVNPEVTQANIHQTICLRNWTKTIRPSVTYTNKLKRKQLASGPYADTRIPQVFEEDHLISLELGGAPKDELNLWPQHWSRPNGAHDKDKLENKLKTLVCQDKIPLSEAQEAIATNWLEAYKKYITH